MRLWTGGWWRCGLALALMAWGIGATTVGNPWGVWPGFLGMGFGVLLSFFGPTPQWSVGGRGFLWRWIRVWASVLLVSLVVPWGYGRLHSREFTLPMDGGLLQRRAPLYLPGRYEVALRFYKEREGGATMDRDQLHRLARESSATGRVEPSNPESRSPGPQAAFSGEALGSASSNQWLDLVYADLTVGRPRDVVVTISDWDVSAELSAATPSVVLKHSRDKSTIVGGEMIFVGLTQLGAAVGIIVGAVLWFVLGSKPSASFHWPPERRVEQRGG